MSVFLLFTRSVSEGKMSYKCGCIISFSGVISIQTKSFLSAQRQMSLQKRKFSHYLENTMIISVVFETSCYQDTLAMDL